MIVIYEPAPGIGFASLRRRRIEMDTNAPARLPSLARLLGFSGLLPQAAAVALLVGGGAELRPLALGLAFGYAALIFSFLGGVWWGLAAAARGKAPAWVWGVAVLPSLLALAAAWPLASGESDMGLSLGPLGGFIALSVLVDVRLKALGLTPEGWLGLRLPLSLGLGALTLAAALL